MKAFSLALVLVRTLGLLFFFEKVLEVLYTIGTSVFSSIGTSRNPFLGLFQPLVGPTILALIYLFIIFMSKPIASFISASGEDVPDADPYTYLRTGIRIIGLWILVVHVVVIPSFVFGNALSPYQSMVVSIRSIQEALLGSVLGVVLLLFAPQITHIFANQDQNVHIRALMDEQLAQESQTPPDQNN